MNALVERCDFDIGDLIAENYTIEKTLGEGSFGVVYKVKERSSGITYALKLFKFWEMNPKEREAMFARFKMEFETGQVKSHYLVKSIEHGVIKGNPFIVMEFCPNGDLLQFVRKQKKTDFVQIGKEILYGLKDLHSCGKVHRDLKPENVLIKQNGGAALTDFGLSGDKNKRITVRDLLGRPTFIAGTVAYMAPEQAKPKNMEVTVLPTMDLFAYGVMIYYLTTHKFPFGALDNHNDLVVYFKNSREGIWDKNSLSQNPEGKKFYPIISHCLIPDFKKRVQTVDAALALMPTSNDAGITYQSSGQAIQYKVVSGILLRVMQGEAHGSIYKLNELIKGKSRVVTMGRSDRDVCNTLPITENHSAYISRKHCTLELSTNHRWFIRDGQWDREVKNGWRNSLNGTFVNATEVTSDGVAIEPGDIITIGDVKLRVEGY